MKKQLKKINIVEPNISKLPEGIYKQNVILSRLSPAITESDIIIFFVGHDEFRNINMEKIKNKIVLDTIGILNR